MTEAAGLGPRGAAAARSATAPRRAVRAGAVEYLNARPLLADLDRAPGFDLRLDLPSRCAELLHSGAIDVGLIPAIEYLRTRNRSRFGPARDYAIVPDVAISSFGPVASVALYTRKAIGDVRTLALDTSSCSSVALTRVLCARQFHIAPAFESHAPDLDRMLTRFDAAVIIGDEALFLEGGRRAIGGEQVDVEKIDLGDVWSRSTGLPFVYAFWAGPADALTPAEVGALLAARDRGVSSLEMVARDYFHDRPERQAAGVKYLRDNIKYRLGPEECAGLELFYQYAAEVGVADGTLPLQFFERR